MEINKDYDIFYWNDPAAKTYPADDYMIKVMAKCLLSANATINPVDIYGGKEGGHTIEQTNPLNGA